MKRLIALLVVAALADLGTTWYGIEFVGLVEANPAAAVYYSSHGILGLAALSAIAVAVVVSVSYGLRNIEAPLSDEGAIVVIVSVAAVNAIAAIHNLNLIL